MLLEATMVEEAKIEARLVEGVQDLGGMCIKLVPIYFKGLPDRLILLRGERMFFVETKRSKNAQMMVRQRYVRGLLRALGFKVHRVDSMQVCEEFLDMLETLVKLS